MFPTATTEASPISKPKRKRKPLPRCEHNRGKTYCVVCSPHNYCEYKKRRSQCGLCGGGGLCEHNRVKCHCTICIPSLKAKRKPPRCQHNTISKHKCVMCSPHNFCEHKKQRSRCGLCGGGGLCEHKKQKAGCATCKSVGLAQRIQAILAMHTNVRCTPIRFAAETHPRPSSMKDWIVKFELHHSSFPVSPRSFSQLAHAHAGICRVHHTATS